jgi:hypothetical protein
MREDPRIRALPRDRESHGDYAKFTSFALANFCGELVEKN